MVADDKSHTGLCVLRQLAECFCIGIDISRPGKQLRKVCRTQVFCFGFVRSVTNGPRASGSLWCLRVCQCTAANIRIGV